MQINIFLSGPKSTLKDFFYKIPVHWEMNVIHISNTQDTQWNTFIIITSSRLNNTKSIALDAELNQRLQIAYKLCIRSKTPLWRLALICRIFTKIVFSKQVQKNISVWTLSEFWPLWITSWSEKICMSMRLNQTWYGICAIWMLWRNFRGIMKGLYVSTKSFSEKNMISES